jgi:superfamily II DNA or RNA helicase
VLRDLELLPVYDSSEHDLVRDLQVPLLKHSVDYLRGVGFFTSGWLRIASHGITEFVQRGGKARIVLSPILERTDWEALQFGDMAKYDEALKLVLSKRIFDLKSALERDTLNALVWMVADEVLFFRFAVPRLVDYPGNYHDKVGVFKDEVGDSVAIHGSLNDSIQGSLNGEAFSVFRSWDEGQRPYLDKHSSRLEDLWNGMNAMFRVSDITDATKQQIVRLRSTDRRPYILPERKTAVGLHVGLNSAVKLHPFQREAIERWKTRGRRGVFEMATGTGKTITSLAAAVETSKELGKIVLIILVPYLHLLEQWQRNCRDFGFNPILCSSEHDGWQIAVKSQIQDFNLGILSNICIMSVHATAATARFQNAIARLKSQFTLLIGDEVHALGSPQLRNALTEQAEMRLGLSATPRRWFDEEGTKVIFAYFGETCFEFSLEQAIGKYLAPYRYYPQLVHLTEREVIAYQELTAQVTRLRGRTDGNEVAERIKHLLLKRAKIVSSAEQKLPLLLSLLKSIVEEAALRHTEPAGILIYCAPGSHNSVLQSISDVGLRCHEFVHNVTLHERERLLNQFSTGDIQTLVAMKCLDEGVDVPSTRQAFILASSTNPREFVQRRGRILRLAENKKEALVYDFIVVPPPDSVRAITEADTNVLRREMPRFAEFASCSLNEFEARARVRDILDRNEMLNLLDEKPWEVYHELKQWDWEDDE